MYLYYKVLYLYLTQMQNYVVINILIAIISVCHCVCYGLLFLRRGDLEVFMAKRVSTKKNIFGGIIVKFSQSLMPSYEK